MKHVEMLPDWAILALAMLVVAGAYSLFGGIGVLALGVIATGVWMVQIKASASTVGDHLEGSPFGQPPHRRELRAEGCAGLTDER